MSNSLLYITDGSIGGRIDLLSANHGFHLENWTPTVPEPKGGGVWSSPPTLSGRRMLFRNMDNYIDTFTLKVNGSSMDNTILVVQELRRMLEKAVYYWTSDWSNAPVWIVARGAEETNTRYAVIMDYRTPNDDNPYATPFFACTDPTMDEFTLVLEHGPWLDCEPGTNTCLSLTSKQPYYQTTRIGATAPSDGYVETPAGNIATGGQFFRVGNGFGQSYSAGMVFTAVNIPVGATVSEAFLSLIGDAYGDAVTCKVKISAEDTDNAANLTTYANFVARARTTEHTHWTIPTVNVDGDFYPSGLQDILNEVVSRPGWAYGNNLTIFMDDDSSSAGAYREFCAFNHAGSKYPVLTLEYFTSANNIIGGQDTCDGISKVFVANRHNVAQISHIFQWDNSVMGGPGEFSDNLIGPYAPGITQYELTPADPEIDDAVYIGISDVLPDHGPFYALAFNISRAGDNFHGDWQYYNSSTGLWTGIVEDTDNTALLQRAGQVILAFPTQANWGTNDVNGVTGYWIRFIIDNTGPGVTVGTNHYVSPNIYAVVRSGVDVAATSVLGDIPATMSLRISDDSWLDAREDEYRVIQRALISTRSASRGDDFGPFINMSNYQNTAGITVTDTAVCPLTITADSHHGYAAVYTPVAEITTEETLLDITFGDLTPQWYGIYRCLARVKFCDGAVAGVPGDIGLRVEYSTSGSVYAKNDFAYPQSTVRTPYEVLDLGVVNLIPAYAAASDIGTMDIRLAANATQDAVDDGQTLTIYDIYLQPIDEFAVECDSRGVSTVVGGVPTYSYAQHCDSDRHQLNHGYVHDLLVDSTEYYKTDIRSYTEYTVVPAGGTEVQGTIAGVWYTRSNGPAILQANAAQTIFFFFGSYDSIGFSGWAARPDLVAHVSAEKVQRYISMRGAR